MPKNKAIMSPDMRDRCFYFVVYTHEAGYEYPRTHGPESHSEVHTLQVNICENRTVRSF